MRDLANALAWKYNGVPGITLSNNDIVGWPESLGEKPSKPEQASIVNEYRARDKSADSIYARFSSDQILEALVAVVADEESKTVAEIESAIAAKIDQ